MVELSVNGKITTFLCDTGACRTVINEDFPYMKIGTDYVLTRSAHGAIFHTPLTTPTWLSDPEGVSCKIPLIYMTECPINLLGRDGMQKLRLAVVPTSEGGMTVKRLTEKGELFVVEGHCEPHYWYSLSIPESPPLRAGTALLKEGKTGVWVQNQMSPSNLHMTMYYKRTPGPDEGYETKLQKLTPASVTLRHIYQDRENGKVAASVTLNEPLNKLFRMMGAPHVSLYKGNCDRWQDLGPMVSVGERANDWQPDEGKAMYSPSTGLHRIPLCWKVTVNYSVHLDAPK